MRTQLPLSAGQNSFSGLIFSFFLLFSLSLSAQDFVTVSPGDWSASSTWEGGVVPDYDIRNATVEINHDIVNNSGTNIVLRNRGVLLVNGATLDNQSNLNVSKGGRLEATNAEVIIGPGILNNDGTIVVTRSQFFKDGNVINNGVIELQNGCFTLQSGNYNNNDTTSGVGGLTVLGGNAKNSGTFSPGILYFTASGTDGLPGTQSTPEQVAAICAPCEAGETAPSIDANASTAFCEDDTIPSLDSFVSSTAPLGAPLTWSTNSDPFVLGDHVTGDQIPVAGTNYYGFYFDSTNNCASPTVTLNISVNPLPVVTVEDQVTCAFGTGENNDGNATFTADVSDTAGTYSYQWYANDVAINGATGSTYTVSAATTEANNGSVYKVVVTNTSTGCVSEGTGSLTVNNCDIEYAYDFEFKTPGKLSPALLALARTYFDFDQAGEQVNIYDPLIYT
ncbi:MAG: hypothetical protein WBV75_14715, partial [Robiginitalea sp.]